VCSSDLGIPVSEYCRKHKISKKEMVSIQKEMREKLWSPTPENYVEKQRMVFARETDKIDMGADDDFLHSWKRMVGNLDRFEYLDETMKIS